jgi:hypothetical protein
MQNSSRYAVFAVALVSLLAGAAIAVLPAIVVGLVNLFYNSAGGILILLGAIVNLLPHPTGPAPGSGSADLPVFQLLTTSTTAVVARSAAATILCAGAFMLLIAPDRRRYRRTWLTAGLCCLMAGLVGGELVALVLMPAFLAIVFEVIARKAG